jgi:hypothetical protein
MVPRAHIRRRFGWLLVAGFFAWAGSAGAQVDWKKEWERSLQGAKKEGKIVAGIPARAELRKELEKVFKPKFGVDMELMTARGPQNAGRIAAEYNAGVKYFDVFIGGSGTYESLVDAGSQRREELVGWAYLGRQYQHKPISLLVHRRRRHGRLLVQHRIGKT